MSGPLAGLKIVEWAHVHFGPGAGMFMSDMGADVIHVETREGDMMRYLDSMWGNHFLVGPDKDRNTFTEDLLRNKESITLDLSKPEVRKILLELGADDTENFEAGGGGALDGPPTRARDCPAVGRVARARHGRRGHSKTRSRGLGVVGAGYDGRRLALVPSRRILDAGRGSRVRLRRVSSRCRSWAVDRDSPPRNRQLP